MKRDEGDWQKKLSQEGLQELCRYRELRQRTAKLPPMPPLTQPTAANDWLKLLVQTCAPAARESAQGKRLSLDQGFETLFRQATGWEGVLSGAEVDGSTAKLLERAQQLALRFEKDPALRFGAYLFVALMAEGLGRTFGDLRAKQFGKVPLTLQDGWTLGAQFFEDLSRLLRGRVPERKGRTDTALIGLINSILSHQKERLTDDELREALARAGVSVPEGETWRVWLWRARKKGLIQDVTATRWQTRSGQSATEESGPLKKGLKKHATERHKG